MPRYRVEICVTWEQNDVMWFEADNEKDAEQKARDEWSVGTLNPDDLEVIDSDFDVYEDSEDNENDADNADESGG